MSGPHILVVDDNADARETLADILMIAGYVVSQAENGKVALEIAAERRPALMLLDLMMPVMSGWEVVAAMRGEASLQSVPVVIVSAATSPPRDLPVLRKPVGVDELLDTVRRSVAAPGPERR